MNNTSKNLLMLWVFALVSGFCFSPLLAEEEAVNCLLYTSDAADE